MAQQGYTGTLWDNQMIQTEDGSLHLFYLSGWGTGHDGWGHAVATDGVHFVDHGQIFRGSGTGNPPGYGWTGYGMVNVAPAGSNHKYIINFSRFSPSAGQTIFFAVSQDLYTWTMLPSDQNFTMGPASLYGTGSSDRWDGVFSVPQKIDPENKTAAEQYPRYGYWTATAVGDPPVKGPNATDVSAHLSGFGTSENGLHWSPRAAPLIDWSNTPYSERLIGYTELGGVGQIAAPDGTVRWYAMLGGRRQRDTEGYGMWAFVADNAAGPWKPQSQNFALMVGGHAGEACGYDTRFVARENGWSTDPNALLVNHDSSAAGTNALLAPLKVARVDVAGTLRLAYWRGNDALKERPRSPDVLDVDRGPTARATVVGPNASCSWHVRFLRRSGSSGGNGRVISDLARGYLIREVGLLMFLLMLQLSSFEQSYWSEQVHYRGLDSCRQCSDRLFRRDCWRRWSRDHRCWHQPDGVYTLPALCASATATTTTSSASSSALPATPLCARHHSWLSSPVGFYQPSC